MKQISIFVVGVATAFASAAASAQDLTAGKTPAQLFHSDCAECHRSPGSIARTRDGRALADFLREHYTTKSETASALAAYLSSFAVTGTAVRNRGTGVAGPADGEPPQGGRRNRRHGDATATDVRSDTGAIEDTARRRRRSSASGDGEVPRPPDAIAATPASAKSNAQTRDGESHDADAPPSRLRSRTPSGHSSESATAETGKAGAPKARKRRNRMENAEPTAPDLPAQTRTEADVPAVPGPAVRGTSQEGNVSPAPVASPPVEQ